MNRYIGKVAIVTGASAGIGAAIAERLVDSGLKVVGLARRQEKMEALAEQLHGKQGQFYPIKADVSLEDDIVNAFEWVKTNLGPIHILINNAGIGRGTTMIDGDTKKWKEVLDTNVLGLSIATREAIRDMRANKVDGHVIQMNSIAGHQVSTIPYQNIYSASKFAVTALTETVRRELNSVGSKIKITSISPGAVKSEIFKMSGVLDMINEDEFAKLKSHPLLTGEDIADAICYILATPPHVQIHELIIKPIGEKN